MRFKLMGLWKNIVIGFLIIIIICLIAHVVDKRIGSHLTRDCLVIGNLTAKQLTEPVTALYLVTAKLFPVVNSSLMGHWSVIVETNRGYFNISTARYMSIYLYRVYKENAYYFSSNRWEDRLYILKKYMIKDEYTKNPISVYDIATRAMNFYNKDNKRNYNVLNHNCQHAAQFIINTFGISGTDDILMIHNKGVALLKNSLKDTLKGPKIMF